MLTSIDYLVWQLWPYLLLALVLGFGWAWYSCSPRTGEDWHASRLQSRQPSRSV